MMVPRLPHAGSRLLPGAGPGVVQGQYWGLQGQQWGLWLALGHWGQYRGLWSILGSPELVTGSLVSPRVSLRSPAGPHVVTSPRGRRRP